MVLSTIVAPEVLDGRMGDAVIRQIFTVAGIKMLRRGKWNHCVFAKEKIYPDMVRQKITVSKTAFNVINFFSLKKGPTLLRTKNLG